MKLKGQGDLTGKMAGSIAALIILAITVLISTGFIGDIADNTVGISGTGNVTGTSQTVVDIVPVVYALAILAVPLGAAISFMRFR